MSGDETRRQHPVAGVDRLIGVALEPGSRTHLDDPVALHDDRAIAEEAVTAPVERDHVAGVNQDARHAQPSSPSPKSPSWRPSGRRIPAMVSKSAPPRKWSRASAIGRSCWVT